MRYRVRDLPAALRTPVGRGQLRGGASHCVWPALAWLATAHRATRARRARVVVVVGSFGKTTTARALAMALGQVPRPDIGHNSSAAAARTVLRVRAREPHAIVEIGISRRGTMARYARMTRPDAVVVTSIGSEHNRSLGDLEATRAEKATMVRALRPSGLAVLNGDDPNVRWMAGQTAARVVTFGLEPGSDVRATGVEIEWPAGTRFTLHARGLSHRVKTRLIGRHMVYPILAALALALEEGVPVEEALPRLEALEPTAGRLQPVRLASGAFLLRDDFKGTLETIDAAIDVLALIPARRRIVVLGDVSEPPGSQGPIYRRIGERLAGTAEHVVVVGGNFRRYAVGAERAGMPRGALADAGRSVLRAAALVGELGPGDVVLLKGRDTQRLGRVALALAGRQVRCELSFCDLRAIECETCPMLERGWDGLRPPRI